MTNVVHMRDFAHNYDFLRRHALRGAPVWPDRLVNALWLLAWCVMVLDLWLMGLGT